MRVGIRNSEFGIRICDWLHKQPRFSSRDFRVAKLGQCGVSLVEMLLVMGLLSIFLVVIATIFAAAVDTQSQTQSYSTVTSDGQFIVARLEYDIARASAIATPVALGDTTTSLVMTVSATSYTYALSGSNLQLNDGTATNLNGGDTTVSALSFQKLGNAGGKETIRYSFTLTSRARPGSGPKVEVYSNTVERR